MAALRHMTDNDLKELGVPMVSISPTICTKGISVDRAGFLGQMTSYVVMFCFLSSNFFCKVVIRLQEQYLYSFCFCPFLPLPSLAALCLLSLFHCLSTFKP